MTTVICNANLTKFNIDEITPQSVKEVDYFVQADFPNFNKENRISGYLEQTAPGEFTTDRVRISTEVMLSTSQWNLWIENLLSDQIWLSGKGAWDSDFKTHAEHFHLMTKKDQQKWREASYRTDCVLVKCGWVKVVVDPQGYNYARYVGINVQTA